MANNQQVKKALIVVGSIGALVAFSLWYLGFLGGSEKTKESIVVPNGYSHQKSVSNEKETVHTFKKSPPQLGSVTQTNDQAYARYMQSLPDKLDKAIAQEFRTLNVSLQNAKLYADATGLIRQGRENMNQLNQMKDKQNAKENEQAMSQNNVNFLVERSQNLNQAVQVKQSDSEVSDKSDALGNVILEGVVGTDEGYYALLRDAKGNPFTLKPGQKFENGMGIKSVNSDQVVIRDGDEERIITVM